MVRLGATLLLSALVLTGLSVPLGPLPPLGALLEPFGGFWTVAEDAVPVYRQTLGFPGLEGPVEVFRDQDYVPHVFAESDEDLFRAVGYLHASDRLFQMDLQRRAATGSLAEVLGPEFVETDRFFRSIGMNWAVERTLEAYDEATLTVLEAYAEGVNARLREVGSRGLPLEFKLLNYEPRPWTPADSIAFVKLMGWSLSGTFEDLELQLFVDAYGLEAAEELFPVDMPLQPIPIVRPGHPPLPPPAMGSSEAPASLDRETLQGLLAWAQTAERVVAPFQGLGSNNWAVAPERSATGSALLANDPHLALNLPALWYQMRLASPSFNVHGVSLLGVPLVVLGFNENIAWGFTNVGADVVDFYVEELDPTDPTRYRHANEWKEFEVREEVIRVRGAADIPLQINITVHGPMITEAGERVAVNWTGHLPTFEVRAGLRLNRATNWDEFRAALVDFHVPAQNVVYADGEGNIGIVVNGLYPIRSPECPGPQPAGRLPMDGASGDCGWVGVVPMEEVPDEFNPRQGYVLSANQKPVGPWYGHYLGWSWADRYRAERIDEVLAASEAHDDETMKALQLDHVSKAAEAFVPFLLEAYDEAGLQGPEIHPRAAEVIRLLRDWDFVMDKDRAEPSIYWIWLHHYREATFRDEWREAGLEGVRLPSVTVLEWLSLNEASFPWFHDVSTPQEETRDAILLRALVEALDFLVEEMGQEPEDWTWDRLHRIQLRHLTGLGALSTAVLPRDGGSFTVDVAHGGFRDGRLLVTTGPSWRLVVDLGTPIRAWGVYPGGQSGNPLSPHYADLWALWMDGEYQVLGLPSQEAIEVPVAANGRRY